MKRIYFISLILVIMALVLTSCSSPSTKGDDTASDEELVLTLDELAEFDGKDGSPAYIAVDGIIYDVTDSSMWAAGEHNGFEAGKDLTEEIKDVSPHGVSVLDRIPVVGKIAD